MTKKTGVLFDIYDYLNTDEKVFTVEDVIGEMVDHISDDGMLVDLIRRADNIDYEVPIDDMVVYFSDCTGPAGSEGRKKLVEKASELVGSSMDAIRELARIGLNNVYEVDPDTALWAFIGERPAQLQIDTEEDDDIRFDIETLDLARAKARGILDEYPDAEDDGLHLRRYEELKNDPDRLAKIEEWTDLREKFAVDHVGPGPLAYELVRRAERLYMVYREGLFPESIKQQFLDREEKYFAEALVIHYNAALEPQL